MNPQAWLQELGPGDVVKTSHAVDKMICSIGSDSQAAIHVKGRGVAGVHAQVRSTPRGQLLELLDGDRLIVNGRRVEQHVLQAGDVLDLGAVRLRFYVGPDRSRASGIRPAPNDGSGLLGQMARFADKLAADYDVDHLLETMLDTMIAVTQAARGAVILLVDGKPQVRTARNELGSTTSGPLAISDSIVEQVLTTRQPLIVSDALSDQKFMSSQSVVDFKICSVLCVPLAVRGEALGAIYLGNDNVVNLFAEKDRDVATVFAAQAASTLKNAMMVNALRVTNATLTQQIERMNFGSLIGASSSMRELFKKVEKVAATEISVLIEGETGTGKELVAGEIHRRSARAKGPFIVINCGAIPENLLESELFGHARGAFTGAVQAQEGKFFAANGGTLFLDEIGEMPLALQVKLLRVLQERKIVRVGETHARDVDIRVIAATNRTLADEVKAGRFREDLYYRLNVVRLTLPPLRDREEDMLLLARYFLKRHAEELRVPVDAFSEDAIRAIQLHRWPGNIRELDNRVKKALVFCEGGKVTATDLELGAIQPDGKVENLTDAKETFARGYVKTVLDLNGGNRAQTAKDLGVDVRTIYRYLEREKGEEP